MKSFTNVGTVTSKHITKIIYSSKRKKPTKCNYRIAKVGRTTKHNLDKLQPRSYFITKPTSLFQGAKLLGSLCWSIDGAIACCGGDIAKRVSIAEVSQ